MTRADPAVLTVPALSLVVLMGASGSGKSTLAAQAFASGEVISSDAVRAQVAGDPAALDANEDTFAVLHDIVARRLRRGLLTVVDATNTRREARDGLLALAKDHDVLAVCVVLDTPLEVCLERNAARAAPRPEHVVRRQHRQARQSRRHLKKDFREVHVLTPEQVDAGVQVQRRPLWCERTDLRAVDVIGDVHGCADELVELLEQLGWVVRAVDERRLRWDVVARPAPQRTLVFVGDLVDRGPDSPAVVALVRQLVDEGLAVCVAGNHDVGLARAAMRRRDRSTLPAERVATLAQYDALVDGSALLREHAAFLDALIAHFVLDDGALVVAHAGLRERYHGRASGRVREKAVFGESTGARDEHGLADRVDWVADYAGRAAVIYGHTPQLDGRWRNNTFNVDLGCAFGGKLAALRWPERELVCVDAHAVYAESPAPLTPAPPAPAERGRFEVRASDVLGDTDVDTALAGRVKLRADQRVAALETLSRFALDPRLLLYLPPTMSPCETASAERGDLLEHPVEAMDFYARSGVRQVVFEEKHMGSRMVVLLCRSAQVMAERFGIDAGSSAMWSRTGRRFFSDPAHQAWVTDSLLMRMHAHGLWEQLQTDWLLLEGELMPWTAKAAELVARQYAPAALGAQVMAGAGGALAAQAAARGVNMGDLPERLSQREQDAHAMAAALRRYCAPVRSHEDLRFAPFGLLASQDVVWAERPHAEQLAVCDTLCDHPGLGPGSQSGLLQRTGRVWVELADPASRQEAVRRWEQLTDAGGEGMVCKPAGTVVRDDRDRLVQPAVKVRGPEYLRIIYGPEYRRSENLERLRQRSLGRKRSLAQREFALGHEALRRLVAGEPLARVHECVAGILALESEPVDPRL